MNSIIYGIGKKHSQKNIIKSKKSKRRSWDSGWGYCSRIQEVTEQKKPTRKQTLLALLFVEPTWSSSGTFFPSYYFSGWLNFSITPQIQKQTVVTGACLSQQLQDRTFLFSLPPPPSSPQSQSLGHCLNFCTVPPKQAWGFVRWGCQLKKKPTNQPKTKPKWLEASLSCIVDRHMHPSEWGLKMLPNQNITPEPQVRGKSEPHKVWGSREAASREAGAGLIPLLSSGLLLWPQAVLNSPAIKPTTKSILKWQRLWGSVYRQHS